MTSVSFGHIHSRIINNQSGSWGDRVFEIGNVNEWIYVNDLSEFRTYSLQDHQQDIFTPIDTPGPSTDTLLSRAPSERTAPEDSGSLIFTPIDTPGPSTDTLLSRAPSERTAPEDQDHQQDIFTPIDTPGPSTDKDHQLTHFCLGLQVRERPPRRKGLLPKCLWFSMYWNVTQSESGTCPLTLQSESARAPSERTAPGLGRIWFFKSQRFSPKNVSPVGEEKKRNQ